jgi:hypothetical protein
MRRRDLDDRPAGILGDRAGTNGKLDRPAGIADECAAGPSSWTARREFDARAGEGEGEPRPWRAAGAGHGARPVAARFLWVTHRPPCVACSCAGPRSACHPSMTRRNAGSGALPRRAPPAAPSPRWSFRTSSTRVVACRNRTSVESVAEGRQHDRLGAAGCAGIKYGFLTMLRTRASLHHRKSSPAMAALTITWASDRVGGSLRSPRGDPLIR